MDDDRLRARLDDAASSIEAGDAQAMLTDVRRSVARRRRWRAAGAGLAAFALVAGGVVTVAMLSGSGGDEAIRTASPSTTSAQTTIAPAPATEVPATDASTAEPIGTATAEATGPAATSSVIDPAPPSAGMPAAEAVNRAEWLVPWDDGFLAGGAVYTPQPLPSELPPEIIELFPPEVVDLFADGLPETIDEATQMLSAAGLLDEVTTVLAEHPEANEAIYSQPVSAARQSVQFTLDGADWEEVELTLPEGVSNVARVTVAGDRLVVVGGPGAPESTAITVAWTSDLVTWDSRQIDVGRPDVPDALRVNVWPSGLAANESGWVVGVQISAFIDPIEFLPPDLLESMMTGSASSSIGPDGVVVRIEPDGAAEPETHEFTWAELGLDESALTYVGGGRSEVWSAPFGGEPERADVDVQFVAGLAADHDGFLLWDPWFLASDDGVVWRTVETELDAAYPAGVLTTDDGAVMFAVDIGGHTSTWLLDPASSAWAPIDIPDLPPTANPSVFGSSHAQDALVVDAAPTPSRNQTVVFEADGFRATERTDGPIYAYELVDLASGEVVLSETIDLRDIEPAGSVRGPFEHLTRLPGGGMTYHDPETGDDIVTISADVVNEAYEEMYDELAVEESGVRPDLWLVAYSADHGWLVEDLDGSLRDGPIHVARNGDRVLVGLGSEWLTFDLAS